LVERWFDISDAMLVLKEDSRGAGPGGSDVCGPEGMGPSQAAGERRVECLPEPTRRRSSAGEWQPEAVRSSLRSPEHHDRRRADDPLERCRLARWVLWRERVARHVHEVGPERTSMIRTAGAVRISGQRPPPRGAPHSAEGSVCRTWGHAARSIHSEPPRHQPCEPAVRQDRHQHGEGRQRARAADLREAPAAHRSAPLLANSHTGIHQI
jgi:hypothetical protein